MTTSAGIQFEQETNIGYVDREKVKEEKESTIINIFLNGHSLFATETDCKR